MVFNVFCFFLILPTGGTNNFIFSYGFGLYHHFIKKCWTLFHISLCIIPTACLPILSIKPSHGLYSDILDIMVKLSEVPVPVDSVLIHAIRVLCVSPSALSPETSNRVLLPSNSIPSLTSSG